MYEFAFPKRINMLGFEIEDDDERSDVMSHMSSPVRHVGPVDPSPVKMAETAPTQVMSLFPSGIVKVKQKVNKKEDE